MGYIIEVNTKNAILDVIKIAIPVAGIIAGVLLGYILSLSQERRREKRTLRKIGRIILMELDDNYRKLVSGASEQAQDERFKAWFIAQEFTTLEDSIYTTYLSRLCELEPETLYYIVKAYQKIQSAADIGKRYLDNESNGLIIPGAVMNMWTIAVEVIMQAIRTLGTFRKGAEILELPKQEHGTASDESG